MIPKSIIYKQKRKVFTFSFTSSCLPLFSLTFSNMMLIYLKSSTVKCSDSMRRSNSFQFIWKRQQRPVVQSMWLRRQEKRQRPKQKKKLKDKDLQKRRIRGKSQSISVNSGTKCQWRTSLYWRALIDPRSWDLSARKSPTEMRSSNSPPKKLERSNQGSAMGVLQLRQRC